MKKNRESNCFIITCLSCIVLLLTLCFFGISNSVKGTQAASGYYTCPKGGTLSGSTCTRTNMDMSSASCGSGYTTVSCRDSGHGTHYCTCTYTATWVATGNNTEDEKACTSGSACFWVAEAYSWEPKSNHCKYINGVCSCSPSPEGLSQSECKNSWEEDDEPDSEIACWSCSSGYVFGSAAAYKDKCTKADDSYCNSYTNGGNTCGSSDYGSWEESTCVLAGNNWIASNKCCQKSTVKSGNTCGKEDFNKWTADSCMANSPTNAWVGDATGNYCCDVNAASVATGNTCGQTNYNKWSEQSCLADSPTNVWVGDATGNYCCDVNAAIGTGNTCGEINYNKWTESTCNGSWIPNDTNGYCCKVSSGGGTGGSGGGTGGSGGGTGGSGNSNGSSGGNNTDGGTTGTPDSSGNNNNEDVNNDTSDNVEKNPQTGQIVVFIIWFVGLATICYSGWYFKKLESN